MAKSTPGAGATPVAPGVDPLTHVPTQDPETLGQAAAEAEPVGVLQNDQSAVLTKEDDPKALPGNGATEVVETVNVKTKEDITLMDPFSAKHIDIKGAEVPLTSFIQDELAEGGRLEKA